MYEYVHIRNTISRRRKFFRRFHKIIGSKVERLIPFQPVFPVRRYSNENLRS